MATFPKLVVLDVDWTIVKGFLDINRLGTGPGACYPREDNLELESEWKIRDRSNPYEAYWLAEDIPGIITAIMNNGADIAIVSQNMSKALSDRALRLFKAFDPNIGQMRPILDLARYDEVFDGQDKTEHLRRLQQYTGYDYSDMILFDDDAMNNLVRVVHGVTFQLCRDQQGLTWANYFEGIEIWKRMFIGYASMDEGTVRLLTQGKNRVDLKESARWGYASYVTDKPDIAKYFANWIKADAFGSNARTMVCEIFVRDMNLFQDVDKIWVPERWDLMSDIKTSDAFTVAWAQENRDQQMAQWGVQQPYILFSRHFRMEGMESIIPDGTRWNEMVIYSQVQDALLLAIPLDDAELERRINYPYIDFTQQIGAWNIRVPSDTVADCRENGEYWI